MTKSVAAHEAKQLGLLLGQALRCLPDLALLLGALVLVRELGEHCRKTSSEDVIMMVDQREARNVLSDVRRIAGDGFECPRKPPKMLCCPGGYPGRITLGRHLGRTSDRGDKKTMSDVLKLNFQSLQ